LFEDGAQIAQALSHATQRVRDRIERITNQVFLCDVLTVARCRFPAGQDFEPFFRSVRLQATQEEDQGADERRDAHENSH